VAPWSSQAVSTATRARAHAGFALGSFRSSASGGRVSSARSRASSKAGTGGPSASTKAAAGGTRREPDSLSHQAATRPRFTPTVRVRRPEELAGPVLSLRASTAPESRIAGRRTASGVVLLEAGGAGAAPAAGVRAKVESAEPSTTLCGFPTPLSSASGFDPIAIAIAIAIVVVFGLAFVEVEVVRRGRGRTWPRRQEVRSSSRGHASDRRERARGGGR
jgi:hypothetical protein